MQAGQGNTNVCDKFVRTVIKDKEVKKSKDFIQAQVAHGASAELWFLQHEWLGVLLLLPG